MVWPSPSACYPATCSVSGDVGITPLINTAVLPPNDAQTNFKSRKRTRDEANELVVGDAVQRPPKRQKTDFMTSNNQSLPITGIVQSIFACGQAMALSTKSYLAAVTADSSTKRDYASSAHTYDGQSAFDELQDRFVRAQQEVAELQQSLEEERKSREKHVLQTKQDMMLDMVKLNEAAAKRYSVVQREKHHLNKSAKAREKEVVRLGEESTEKDKKWRKAVVDAEMYKEEVEHLHTVNKTMEEDLDELRQIENADAAERDKRRHLPPAYGSLDDEESLPSPCVYEDCGSLDVATFKRAVRSDFTRKLRSAEATSRLLRRSSFEEERRSADVVIFIATSGVLASSSRSLCNALDYTETTLTTQFISHADKENVMKCNSTPKRSIRRVVAKRGFVADRIAKVILDLTWRVISACEVRPAQMRLSPNEKTTMSLAYKEADDCLLEALRHAFDNTDTPEVTNRAFEYQYYATQVEAVQDGLSKLGADVNYQYFCKSHQWLEEQVETERMNRASFAPTQSDNGMLTRRREFSQRLVAMEAVEGSDCEAGTNEASHELLRGSSTAAITQCS